MKGQRFIQDRVKLGMQRLILARPFLHTRSICRVCSQPGFNFKAARIGKRAIHKSMQVFFAYVVCHFTTFNCTAGSPASICRIRSRARERRDITVPTGTPRTWAASS